MNHEYFAEDGMLLDPTGGREKEIEIGSDGNNGNLKEIEHAKPVNAGRSVVGGREEQQENRSRPNEEEDV